MKKYIFTALLLIGLLTSSNVFAQKEKRPEPSRKPNPEMMRRIQQSREQQQREHKATPGRPNPEMLERMQAKQMETKARELDIEARYRDIALEEKEMGLNARRKMQEMELDKQWLELEAYKAKLKQSVTQKPSCGKTCSIQDKKGYSDKGNKKDCGGRKCCPVFLGVCFLIHILLTIWVFQDIRKRNSGSGLWIVITLLAGFFGALLYLLARIGDKQE